MAKPFSDSVKYKSQKTEDNHEISVQSLKFADKRVLFVKFDGEVDITYDVQAPDSKSLYDILSSSTISNDFTCDKTCLMGDGSNIKVAVIINHIAKLLYSTSERTGLIISISSKLFKNQQTSNSKDFDILIQILSLIKEVIN
ncbi:Proteasome chaperone 3 [Wickerhamomyces ciferrii]|uniref:Proteasome chaperone 3 n=1 Tax=Wickerhamomyces ciferrii (strain ATCC 14091 / BCRC 22168 / CBS 111 / JCM 3599 / NBRC 0793 / NRRL Y-1031 F-60-10) TaxID=1206466 RepID=K0KRH7_WICCF|nr:Proteasome chaperone 3 [Wickerhamomyces ciferrii]CCH44657.1 Proteasome chaperone 3 [Wickerhamomyces ciferrii]